MTASELRKKYLDFFKSKGHAVIPSASLVPENDPSVLFTTAGMHPLVPYLLGEKHPGGTRLVNVQKCIRTVDIDEVGDTTHHTFFEMLGNWSFGDYFKQEALEWSWEFLTSPQWLGLDKNRLAVSVFEGDADAPFDEIAYNTWKNIGISEKKIAKLPKKNNWWGMETGPCGPDSEMFYWVGDPNQVPESFNDDNVLWVEIWNNVFMEFNKLADGNLEALSRKNVDTGMGLERTLAAINGLDDNYKTELFSAIIGKIEELSGKKYTEDDAKAMRVVADHLRAAVFIVGDDRGISPSNAGQGYIVRRLLRRAIRYAKILGIENNFTGAVAAAVIAGFGEAYPELQNNQVRILADLEKEENKFRNTLDKGLKEFNKLTAVNGLDAFNLYQSYGFPLEMTEELASEKGIAVNREEFAKEFKKHQDLSRTAAAGAFKGGLADSTDAAKKLHTAAHLMLSALRQVLGEHVFQKGSNITAERLRFDFSHPAKMTTEEIKKVEDLVNGAIGMNLPVVMEEMGVEEAKQAGAMGVFDSKYGDKVKVYTAGDFSREICGGPHASNTGELGKFRITKEEASSAGVRRIKAILE